MKVLFLCRHFPPAPTGGARRPYFLAKALQDAGCEIKIIAPDAHPDFLSQSVPHAHRDPVLTSGGKPKQYCRSFLRSLLLWPDPDISWAKACVRLALSSGDDFLPDVIITTSPPESLHYAGYKLKQAYGAVWVADFRDHWLDSPHRIERNTFFRKMGERIYAKHILRKADIILSVNNDILEECTRFAPKVAQYEFPHFSPPPVSEKILPDPFIHIVYTGGFSLSERHRAPSILLAPFEQALRTNPQLFLHIAGRFLDEEIKEIKKSPAIKNICIYDYLTLEDAHALQYGADALALMGTLQTYAPGGKMSEYQAVSARTGAPIIAFGEGPWRTVAKLDTQNTHETLVRLKKRNMVKRQASSIYDAQAAAEAFLKILEQEQGLSLKP
ncbi:MAG: hypothetical protein COA43_13465 [Robiginitomaculum sp.]|nr:MAG: hypothetical protein COA43_13465 [Robiginitomaculum sp.]